MQSEKCPVGEIVARANVWSGKCQVGEVSVGELSSRGSVGRGNVQSGKCPDFLMQYLIFTNIPCWNNEIMNEESDWF